MQGEDRDARGCAGMSGCTSVGWGREPSAAPGACAPDVPSQPWHWGGHEMIVALVPAGLWVLWVLWGAPVPPQVQELTERMGGSGALCRPSSVSSSRNWMFFPG